MAFDPLHPNDSFLEADRVYPVHDPDAPSLDDPLSTDDLERLYQQALRAVEFADAVEEQLGFASESPEASEPTPVAERSAPLSQMPSRSSSDVTRRQILEAVLFVGGTDLTLKKLSRLLGDEDTDSFLETEIAALNELYQRQGRPYTIQFGEGGYYLDLNSEFERIRHRVFGIGPKDVKLSQDALEVLAMVAYRQPVTKDAVEATGKKNAGPLLNQLLRRELVSLNRKGKGRDAVTYSTTPRFLQIFGLTNLDDLPLPDDLSFK
jgi:segregation and condensation protein B